MATTLFFTEEEMAVDECLGYPKAYAKLCQDPDLNPYSRGPPLTFIPFALPYQEVSRARELDQLFPVVDQEAKPSIKPKIYSGLLWKQLNHLGNAGFDPAQFRVDPYGNVVYYHADPASPLAWNIDHWFPCSRGGRTVPCNLRILQSQVYKKKHNKLEFLVPWWDLQLGISVNQFLSIFASSNSDFRNRAFSLLFSEGENHELGDSESVDSHVFPQHFIETKQKVGLAPAALVLSRKQSSSVLKSVDLNRKSRAHSATADARKSLAGENDEGLCKSIQMFRPSVSKENANPDSGTSPYLTIAMARDSLRNRDEMQEEIHKLDKELDELNNKNELERVSLQNLEATLIKRRRRAEKSRRLAEAQSSYKALLEKMIRDAMHQSVIYKEQLRLNQAATSALMARLEAQKAICDSSERDLHRKHKEREEIENQIKPHWVQARKRSRTDDELIHEERGNMSVLSLPETTKPRKHLQKELRVFLEEEHKASQDGLSPQEEPVHEDIELPESNMLTDMPVEHEKYLIEDKLQKLDIGEFKKRMKNTASVLHSPEKEDEECRKQRGKGNVEKWLQILLDDPKQSSVVKTPCLITDDDEKSRMDEIILEGDISRTDEIIKKLNLKNPQKEIRILKFPVSEEKAGFNQNCAEVKKQEFHGGSRTEQVEKEGIGSNAGEVLTTGKGIGSCKSFQGREMKERCGKDTGLTRSESARAFRPIPYSPSESARAFRPIPYSPSENARTFRPIPYSPSIILGMKKGVDCIGKKPQVIGSDEESDLDRGVANNIFRSSIKTIKRAVKI